MSKFVNQLKRELKRSPAKAAALSVGILLAIWFWLPLLSEWFGGEEAERVSAQTTKATSSANSAPGTAAAATAKPAPLDWRELQQWKQTSGYCRTYLWHAEMRDPFAVMVGESEQQMLAEEYQSQQQQQVEQEAAQLMLDQQRLAQLENLELTSTLIMPGRRSATINGKVYREGELVVVERNTSEVSQASGFGLQKSVVEDNATQQVVVRQIETRRVVLQYGNELYPLPLNRKRLGDIRFERR